MYIDSHCHIDGPKFSSDRDAMLDRARAAGVRRLLAIGNGEGPGTFACAIPYAEQHDWIWATIGIHPHEAKIADCAAYDELAQLARHPRVLAWGEIGLDYHYDFSPRDVQQRVFIEQMALARAASKPIIIHCRPSDNSENAWDDCLRLIREHWASTGLGGIFHCFTGTVDHAGAALDLGFIISFAGNITYPKTQNIRDAAAMVPLDRFFIETDCPYLAPIPHRGRRNEPAFVVETARQVGQLRGISGEEAGLHAAQNFERFFNLPAATSA